MSAEHLPPWAKDYCPTCHLKWEYAGCEPGVCRFKQCPSCGFGLAPGREYPGIALRAEMEALLRELFPYFDPLPEDIDPGLGLLLTKMLMMVKRIDAAKAGK